VVSIYSHFSALEFTNKRLIRSVRAMKLSLDTISLLNREINSLNSKVSDLTIATVINLAVIEVSWPH
jgi:hypothetical protein